MLGWVDVLRPTYCDLPVLPCSSGPICRNIRPRCGVFSRRLSLSSPPHWTRMVQMVSAITPIARQRLTFIRHQYPISGYRYGMGCLVNVIDATRVPFHIE
jgi:hypothetical protein